MMPEYWAVLLWLWMPLLKGNRGRAPEEENSDEGNDNPHAPMGGTTDGETWNQ